MTAEKIDSEDLIELILKIEKSFDIRLEDVDLERIANFGELCDYITSKLQLDNSDDCTKQQAFYKLREAISSTLHLDKNVISLDDLLTDILPRLSRRSRVKKIENHLGFKLNLLRPPHWVLGTLLIILLASIIILFFNWKFGLEGIFISITGLWIAKKTGKELDSKTVKELVENMTRENYLKSRRNKKTFNKKEIEKVLTDWTCKDLGIDKSNLTRQTTFK